MIPCSTVHLLWISPQKVTWVLTSEFPKDLKSPEIEELFFSSFAKLFFQFSVWNENELPPDLFPYWVQRRQLFITQQWGALSVVSTWAYTWVTSQMFISGFTAACVRLKRNKIDVYNVLIFKLCTAKGKMRKWMCSHFMLFIMVADTLSSVVCS